MADLTASELRLKAERAAKRKQRAEYKRKEENQKLARLHASANGLSTLTYLDDSGGEPAKAWRVRRLGDKYFPPVKRDEDGSYEHYRIFANGEYADLRVYVGLRYSDKVVAVLERGGGGYAVLWMQSGGLLETFAVGCYGGEAELVRMPDLDPHRLSANNRRTKSASQ